MSALDFAAIHARGVADIARQLGLDVHQAGKHLGPCPACKAMKRHPSRRDRRGAIGLRADGLGWQCHECGEKGDAVTLAAWVVTGRAHPDDWTPVREALAGFARTPPALPSVAQAPKRPPRAEVEALWNACYPLDAVPADVEPEWTGDVRVYLGVRRKIELSWQLMADVARVLPPPARYSYPAWWPSHWPATWRLVVGAYEPNGELASVHARAIVDLPPRADGSEPPKTRWPDGCRASGLLFADRLGRGVLRGEPVGVDQVVLVEGLTDLLAMAGMLERRPRHTAVLGGTSGSWSALSTVRWPARCSVIIATDPDVGGEKHAIDILRALPVRIPARRVNWAALDRSAA